MHPIIYWLMFLMEFEHLISPDLRINSPIVSAQKKLAHVRLIRDLSSTVNRIGLISAVVNRSH